MKPLPVNLRFPTQLVALILTNVVALICLSQYYKFSCEYQRSDSESYAGKPDKFTLKQDNYEIILDKLNRDKVAQDNPILIKLIREHFIEFPSTEAYKLCNPGIKDYSDAGQSSFADRELNQMENGFYVECGGYDGETASNTLLFEKTRKWTGLLIEPDPTQYNALKTKNRKAFSVNSCLSLEPYPASMTFNRDLSKNTQMGRVIHGREVEKWIKKRRRLRRHEITVQCFPLYSLLLAINTTKIDFLSLDVEGDELYILKTIPFEKVDIKMLNVEYCHQLTNGEELVSFLRSKGYENITTIQRDIIFKKKDRD